MTSQAPERRTILAAVQALGKQEKSDGWMLTLGYKFSGSKYNLVLYGKDWEQVNHLKLGEMAKFLVEKGGQKRNKEGQPQDPQYDSSFFWNLVEAKLADGAAAPTPSAPSQPPAPRQVPPGAVPDPLEGLAQSTHAAKQDERERAIDINVAINQGREAAQFMYTRLYGDSEEKIKSIFFALWHECANEAFKMQRGARGEKA